MGLSDPFSTTYEGSRQALGQYGAALQSVASQYAARQEQEKIRNQGMQLLKQSGIITSDGSIDENRATDLGVEFKSSGEVTIKPTQKVPTLVQQIQELQTLEEAKKKGLISSETGFSFEKGGIKIKSSSTSGYGTAQLKYAKENASIIADAVEEGDYGALAGLSKTAMMPIVVELKKRGLNVDEALLGYKAMQSAVGNTKIVDQKVMNAGSAQVLLNSSYDAKSGNYIVPPPMHAELAIATARMLSPTGVVSDDRVDELRQVTAREGLAKAAIWMGFNPSEIGGSTQSVINLFSKTIKREGEYAEQIRDMYVKGKLSKMSDIPSPDKSLTDTAGLTPPKNMIKIRNRKTGETKLVPSNEVNQYVK